MRHVHKSRPSHFSRVRQGFTLLELMMSIGIFGAIMSIVAQSIATASSASSTLQIAANLQSEAAIILDRIALDMRGARFPTPPGALTSAGSISFQTLPAFSSSTLETDLFVGYQSITISNVHATAEIPAISPDPAIPATAGTPTILDRNYNGTVATLSSKVVNASSSTPPTEFSTVVNSLGITPAPDTGFFYVRIKAKSLRLYLFLSETDSSGNTVTRYAMRDVPTYN